MANEYWIAALIAVAVWGVDKTVDGAAYVARKTAAGVVMIVKAPARLFKGKPKPPAPTTAPIAPAPTNDGATSVATAPYYRLPVRPPDPEP